MKSIAKNVTLHIRDDPQWQRIVMAEVLVPDTPNVFNDYWTRDAIVHAAYSFMMSGFGIDVEHDNVDILGEAAYVVESFIARDGDPVFIPGSWVIGMYIADDDLWQQVLDGNINGYSYEALVSFLSATISWVDDGIRTGLTEPDPVDGHTHSFMVMVDISNRPIDGGTTETDGHSHTIKTHTVTEEAEGHVHRYNLVTAKELS